MTSGRMGIGLNHTKSIYRITRSNRQTSQQKNQEIATTSSDGLYENYENQIYEYNENQLVDFDFYNLSSASSPRSTQLTSPTIRESNSIEPQQNLALIAPVDRNSRRKSKPIKITLNELDEPVNKLPSITESHPFTFK